MGRTSPNHQTMHYQSGMGHNGNLDVAEDIRVIDEEILELQEYNSKAESEMMRLKSDINQMEQQVKESERVFSVDNK